MMRARFARLGIGIVGILALVAGAAGSASANGMLGIFFDKYGQNCSANINAGGGGVMYVVFLPDGDTRSGITSADFRIEMQDADGYNILGTQALLPIGLGDPFNGGIAVASGECLTDLAIPLLSIQFLSLSGGNNAKFIVKAVDPPRSPQFPCALVTLCDSPIFTTVCVETGKAVVNPTGGTECGSNSESAEWGVIKGLYR